MDIRLALYLIPAGALAVMGDILARKWADGRSVVHIVGAAVLYAAVYPFWFLMLGRARELGKVGPMWAAGMMTATVVAGCAFFGETFTVDRFVGIMMCVCGIVMLSK